MSELGSCDLVSCFRSPPPFIFGPPSPKQIIPEHRRNRHENVVRGGITHVLLIA